MSERKQGLIEQLIRGRVAEHPDQEWLLWRDEAFSWADTLSNTQRVANGLLEQGVQPGDKVAIMMGNRPEFLWT
ncbi:MAG: AMP-binding protein, partial [Actinobacteria bacterium]|nr:AMP-binding protein [Actinomycetota bacterium]